MKAVSSNNSHSYSDLSGITTYQAGVLQATAHRLLQKQCDIILRPYDITKMQWLIIGTILDAGEAGVRITDLAKKLDTTLSYLTNTINLLESKQMLVRAIDERDVRAKIVRVDDAFKPKCADIEAALRQGLRESIYAHISPEDFRVYMKVMAQLSEITC